MFFNRLILIGLLAFSSLIAFSSHASVVISGTRVIYLDSEKEVSVKMTNRGIKPVLIQSWIDDGDPEANPSTIQVPFILTPPINRVEASEGQTLRVFYTGEQALPKTEESVFWLNVLEIPTKNNDLKNENTLQLAFRSRIKLFFRPENLPGSANNAAKELTWTATTNGISVQNTGPYHVSLTAVSVEINGKTYQADSVEMLSPNSSDSFKFSGLANTIPLGSKINIEYIDDYGARKNFEASMQ